MDHASVNVFVSLLIHFHFPKNVASYLLKKDLKLFDQSERNFAVIHRFSKKNKKKKKLEQQEGTRSLQKRVITEKY